MRSKDIAATIRKPKFTSVGRTMKRLDKNRYQILQLVGAGRLEAESLDDHFIVFTDSLEKLEEELRA
jgi:hypothetical protein